MDKYIKPVKKMLHEYKKSVKIVKEHSEVLEEAMLGGKLENQENTSRMANTHKKAHVNRSKRSQRNSEKATIEELDEEIEYLTKKINLIR